MGRQHRLDRNPELRRVILSARGEGLTLDQLSELCQSFYDEQSVEGAPPSRSSLGRYIKRIDNTALKIRETREAAHALASVLTGEESSVLEGVAEMLSSEMFRLLSDSSDGGLTLPQLASFANTLARMQTAREKSAGVRVKELQAQRQRAAEVARTKAKQAGLSDSVADGIFRAVVGVSEHESPEDADFEESLRG